jgi:hypothetical protein
MTDASRPSRPETHSLPEFVQTPHKRMVAEHFRLSNRSNDRWTGRTVICNH